MHIVEVQDKVGKCDVCVRLDVEADASCTARVDALAGEDVFSIVRQMDVEGIVEILSRPSEMADLASVLDEPKRLVWQRHYVKVCHARDVFSSRLD